MLVARRHQSRSKVHTGAHDAVLAAELAGRIRKRCAVRDADRHCDGLLLCNAVDCPATVAINGVSVEEMCL